jgi:uncharacterized protein (TIGR03067 family)
MKRRWLLVVCALGLLGAEAKEDEAKKELKKLQGTWVMAALEWDGGPPAEQDVTTDARRELVIVGNTYTEGQIKGSKRVKGFIRIDPSKKPKTMDRSRTADFKKVHGSIYELDGDRLKECSFSKAPKPGARPAKFETKPKSGVFIIYWVRKGA